MGFELTTLVVMGTDCIGNYKSNYHTITTTTSSLGKKGYLSITQLALSLEIRVSYKE